MHLDLRYFSTSELHYWRGTFLHICDDFAAQAFTDWDDEGFRIVHDLHTVLLDEIDRRSSADEASRQTAPTKPMLPCETIRILED